MSPGGLPRNTFGDTRGPTGNGVQDELLRRRMREKELVADDIIRVAVVVRHDRANNTVDLVYKDSLNMPPLRNVRIFGMGGSGVRYIPTLQTIESGSATPDVGLIIHPRGDVRRIFENFERQGQKSNSVRRPSMGAIFIPGAVVDSQEQDLSALADGDSGLLTPTGNGIIFRGNGDVEVVTTGKFYYNGSEVDTGVI